jgi:hypothetical protein
VLQIVFAAAVGHVAWQTVFGPPVSGNYFVGGSDLPALTSPHPEFKNLYLRRNLYLSQQPRRAWLQLLGKDEVWLIINGNFVEEQDIPGFPIATVVEISPWLHVGHNVIAILNRRSSINHTPAVAVTGVYELADGEHRIEPDDQWRCNSVFDRSAHYWFSPTYDDRKWEMARLTRLNVRAKALVPPRSATMPRFGKWISSPELGNPRASLRREFALNYRPKLAWLRVTAKSSFRLALNGIIIDQQEDQIGTAVPVPPMERVYDITPLLRMGNNVLAAGLTKTADLPRILIDGEIEGYSDERTWIGTDEHWQACQGLARDWQALEPENPASWKPCGAELGDLGVMPWQPRRHQLEVLLPVWDLARRTAAEIGFMGLVFAVTAISCRLAGRLLLWLRGESGKSASPGVIYLALVPAILAAIVAALATLDPRLGPENVYRTLFLSALVLSVPAQWGLLALAIAFGHARKSLTGLRPERALSLLLMLAIVAVGFGIRFLFIASEPLQWDEVENARATKGFLERGFPSYDVGEHLPPKIMETSELVFVPSGAAALFFEDGRYFLRFPSICWSTLTIILLYVMGRRLFTRPVGLVAAAVFALSPMSIGMCTFGRYFAQVQFLTLFTVYAFWLTIYRRGPINTKALWLTAISFIAVYLSWEVAALTALGMIAAVLVHRRGRLRTVLQNRSVWLAMAVVLLAIGLQYSNRELSQTQYLWYGISLSDITLRPMWRYPVFRPFAYVLDATWNQDALIPLLGLAAGFGVALRHAFRHAMRFMLMVFCITCGSLALVLPAFASRYGDFLMPMLVLISSASLVAIARALVRLAWVGAPSFGWPSYGQAIGVLVVCTVAAAGGGLTLQLYEISTLRVVGYGLRAYKFPNLQGPTQYLYDHVQKGDLVLASDAQQIRYLMKLLGERSDWPEYKWLANTLFLPATIDDVTTVPRDRRDGTQLTYGLKQLEQLFARYDRVWYIVCPDEHRRMNTSEVTAFIMEHMDVVYEDYDSFLFLRGDKHRDSGLRLLNRKEFIRSQINILPSMAGG